MDLNGSRSLTFHFYVKLNNCEKCVTVICIGILKGFPIGSLRTGPFNYRKLDSIAQWESWLGRNLDPDRSSLDRATRKRSIALSGGFSTLGYINTWGPMPRAGSLPQRLQKPSKSHKNAQFLRLTLPYRTKRPGFQALGKFRPIRSGRDQVVGGIEATLFPTRVGVLSQH